MHGTRQQPAVSVYELTLLFDEHPTVGIIEAIMEQLPPAHWSKRHLLRAMYAVPFAGPLPDEFAWRLTDEQERTIDLGHDVWMKGRRGA